MTGATLVLATLALGVDYGWQPTEQGELEYIIQIEPELVQSLLEGREISSEVFPELKDVRRFRIRVGDAELPRETPPAPEAPPENESADQPAAPPNTDANGAVAPETPPAASDPLPQEHPPADATDPVAPSTQAESEQTLTWPGSANAPPAPLRPDPGSRAMEHQQAGYVQDSAEDDPAVPSPSDAVAGESPSGSKDVAGPSGPEQRWWPLTAAIVALFTSLGGNAYLAWIAADFRSRYQSLAARRVEG